VTVRPSGAVVVEDAGPGFADPEAALARGVSGADSTGIGLDIARQLADDTGGSLHIDRSELGGARVVLALGVVQDSAPAEPAPRRWWRRLGGAHARA
jgi:signal transduction histidine kinase